MCSTFVVSEVHPFADGNGRTARVAMNHFLSNAGLTRIIVPTVYRDDYIGALKALTNGNPVPLPRMLTRAARFSRWLDMSSKPVCFAALETSNAMKRPDEARLLEPRTNGRGEGISRVHAEFWRVLIRPLTLI